MIRYFCVLLLLCCVSLSASPFREIPAGMQPSVNQLMGYGPTREFLDSFDQPIALQWLPMGEGSSNAFWSMEKQLIALNASKQWNSGEMMYSILFELHNAKASPQLKELDRQAAFKQISKSDYVYSVESVEYQNVVKTTHLLEQGVRMGYLPRDMYLPDILAFPQHLQLQQQYGHSAFIAKKYDVLSSGSLPSYLT